jgi:hypothetical protein
MQNNSKLINILLVILILLIAAGLGYFIYSKNHTATIPSSMPQNIGTQVLPTQPIAAATPMLLPDVYPLPANLQWSVPTAFIFHQNTSLSYPGYKVTSDPVPDFNFDFQKYYDTKLQQEGWVQDIDLDADGVSSSEWGYMKGNSIIFLSYKRTPLPSVVQDPNTPGIACPCTTVYTIITGTKN